MQSQIEKFASGMHYFRLPPEFTITSQKRFICTIKDESFHCAIMTKKEGDFFINLGRAVMMKLFVSEGDEIHFELKPDTSKYQFDFPEEMEEVLNTDDEAYAIFTSLTDGNKRSLIYLVNQVKSVDKKIERSLLIAEKLKAGITSARLVMKK